MRGLQGSVSLAVVPTCVRCPLVRLQVGPTVILHRSKEDRAMHEEIFGPVLSVYVVSSWEEAIAIENANPFGNAASIYTTVGGNAEWFIRCVSACGAVPCCDVAWRAMRAVLLSIDCVLAAASELAWWLSTSASRYPASRSRSVASTRARASTATWISPVRALL
jgi:hypothetical protein